MGLQTHPLTYNSSVTLSFSPLNTMFTQTPSTRHESQVKNLWKCVAATAICCVCTVLVFTDTDSVANRRRLPVFSDRDAYRKDMFQKVEAMKAKIRSIPKVSPSSRADIIDKLVEQAAKRETSRRRSSADDTPLANARGLNTRAMKARNEAMKARNELAALWQKAIRNDSTEAVRRLEDRLRSISDAQKRVDTIESLCTENHANLLDDNKLPNMWEMLFGPKYYVLPPDWTEEKSSEGKVFYRHVDPKSSEVKEQDYQPDSCEDDFLKKQSLISRFGVYNTAKADTVNQAHGFFSDGRTTRQSGKGFNISKLAKKALTKLVTLCKGDNARITKAIEPLINEFKETKIARKEKYGNQINPQTGLPRGWLESSSFTNTPLYRAMALEDNWSADKKDWITQKERPTRSVEQISYDDLLNYTSLMECVGIMMYQNAPDLD